MGAEKQWRAVVAELPGYRQGWRGLGDALIKAGKLAEAEKIADWIASDVRLEGEGAILAVSAAAAQREIGRASCRERV